MCRSGHAPRDRSGFSTLWLILTLPIFLTLFAFVFEMGHMWVARVELENGLESAALAAVRSWAESGSSDTYLPRQVGAAYAANNTVRSYPLVLGLNHDPAAGPDNPNQNLTCTATVYSPVGAVSPEGNLIFGAILTDDPNCPLTFNAGIRPSCGQSYVEIGGSGGTEYAVRAQAVMEVPSPICRLFGLAMPAYRITAFTIAAYSCAERRPRLVRVDQYICPGP
ncbi:MAG: pilus assembly protein [Thermogutta sp.]|nr:pilus assembly protein [Thermogutta sp.]